MAQTRGVRGSHVFGCDSLDTRVCHSLVNEHCWHGGGLPAMKTRKFDNLGKKNFLSTWRWLIK